MNARLLVISGPDAGKVIDLKGDDPLVLGRSQQANLQVNDPRVSRAHCKLTPLGDEVLLADLESRAGCFVNNQRVTSHTMRSGDVLMVGDSKLRLELPSTTEMQTLAPAPVETGPPNLPADRLHELSGKKLSDYQIGAVLAKAHSGIVFHARDSKNRDFAFKVLWPEFARDDSEVQRFIRAMKTMLPLQHPNIVRLYGAGKTGPYCWLAMEFVEGESLTKVIERLNTGGQINWKSALRIAVYVARALEYAHSKQIIHRNITPQNILLGKRPDITKLSDLMFAKAMEGKLAEQITKPGELLGDVRFMSPERTGGVADDVDERSDIWSLGATIYAVLTGRAPFQAASPIQIILKIRKEEPARPRSIQPAIPAQFEEIVLKMLSKTREGRYQSARELLTALEGLARSQGVDV